MAVACVVGRDRRFIAIGNKELPRSLRTLYELTLLDDEGFALLCKPGTRQYDVHDYKATMVAPPDAAPASTTRPG